MCLHYVASCPEHILHHIFLIRVGGFWYRETATGLYTVVSAKDVVGGIYLFNK